MAYEKIKPVPNLETWRYRIFPQKETLQHVHCSLLKAQRQLRPNWDYAINFGKEWKVLPNTGADLVREF